MKIVVQFPEGPRQVEAVSFGRRTLALGKHLDTPLIVPRAVPGYALSKLPGHGWKAVLTPTLEPAR